MFSFPPATTTCASLVRISCTALLIACSPDPQSRLTLKAVVVSGRPALSVASRALKASSPTWPTQPRMTSSTSLGSTPARETEALRAAAPRSEVGRSLKEPANFPIAVLTVPAITTPPSRAVLDAWTGAPSGAHAGGTGVRSARGARSLADPLLGLGDASFDLRPRRLDDVLRLVDHRLHLALDRLEPLGQVLAKLTPRLGSVHQGDGAADQQAVPHTAQISHEFVLL